jgi:hypothetical protein
MSIAVLPAPSAAAAHAPSGAGSAAASGPLQQGATIALVAAPRQQRGAICRARDQFDRSPVFRRTRDYCERTRTEWYILTAAHGLLAPQQVIGPIPRALQTLTAEERAEWAARVAKALMARAARSAEPPTFMLYASRRFADAMRRAAPDLSYALPLAGMPVRQRSRWLDERLHVHPRLLAAQAR